MERLREIDKENLVVIEQCRKANVRDVVSLSYRRLTRICYCIVAIGTRDVNTTPEWPKGLSQASRSNSRCCTVLLRFHITHRRSSNHVIMF